MTATTDQIRTAGDRWVAAELQGDVEALDRMATDDFRLVGPLGFVLDKQQWLDRYRSGVFETTSLAWSDVEVRDYGDAAVSIGVQDQEAAFGGAPSNGSFRITHVWVRDGDQWEIASIQLSPTGAFTPPPNAGTA
jgi:ketosteroid isomerase-like protein